MSSKLAQTLELLEWIYSPQKFAGPTDP